MRVASLAELVADFIGQTDRRDWHALRLLHAGDDIGQAARSRVDHGGRLRLDPLELPPSFIAVARPERLADAVRCHNVRIVCQDKARFYADYEGPSPGAVFRTRSTRCRCKRKEDIDGPRRVGAGLICVHDYRPDIRASYAP